MKTTNRSVFNVKTLIVFTILCARTVLAQAQTTAPTIEWQKSLGGTDYDFASSIEQTIDKGYIVAGHSKSTDGDVTGNHGNYDYWVAKLDSTGVIQWQKSLGGTNVDQANSIQKTTDSGYIVAGYSQSINGDVTNNHGGHDYWVVKLDSTGTIEWQKSLGGTNIDRAYSIRQTTDNGYVVAGLSSSNNGDITGNHGNSDYWVVKLDSTGTIEWQKSLGGTNDESAYSIQQTTDSGYIIIGSSLSNDGDITGNHGNYDYWVVKLDSIGSILWQKSLGGTLDDFANSIQQTIDGGYIIAGFSLSNDGDITGNHGNYDYCVFKLDSTGTIEWQKSLGGTLIDYANSIQQTIDGGYILAGHSQSNDGNIISNHGGFDYWVAKLDSVGTIEWQKSLGGTSDDAAYSIKQTTNKGYIVAGQSQSNDGDVTGHHGSNGFVDYWIVKIAPTIDSIITDVADVDLLSNIKVYPNPFIDEINIEVGDETALITMTDIVGHVVKQITNVSNTVLSMVDVPSGIYFLRMDYKDKLPKVVRIISD